MDLTSLYTSLVSSFPDDERRRFSRCSRQADVGCFDAKSCSKESRKARFRVASRLGKQNDAGGMRKRERERGTCAQSQSRGEGESEGIYFNEAFSQGAGIPADIRKMANRRNPRDSRDNSASLTTRPLRPKDTATSL